ncbi:MAG: hypothetical protein ACI8SE_001871, partial [Bacteroidia bacterium]
MRKAVSILLLLIGSMSHAQIDQYLTKYSISEERGAVLISWTTSAGFTCEDIQVQFGTDSADLIPVYTYPGICGSENKEEHYTYMFRDVVHNQPNYIRIDLGSYGTSPILDITIISVDGLNPKVYPNPATELSTLIFSNPNQEEAVIHVYSTNGQSSSISIITRKNTV